MSNAALTWAIKQTAGNVGAKAVLLLIADHAGENVDIDTDGRHMTWVRLSIIAEHAELDIRSTRRHVAQMEERGLLRRLERRRTDGSQTTNYLILAVGNDGALPWTSLSPPPDSSVRPPGQQDPPPPRTAASALDPSVMNPQGTAQKTSSSSLTRATRTTAKATRVPDDFEPDEEMRQWAATNAPTAGRRDHDEFMDYWRAVPGAKGCKLDWPATWRNWMRRAHDGRCRPSAARPSQFKSSTEKRQDADEALKQLIAQAMAYVEARGGSRDDNVAVKAAMKAIREGRVTVGQPGPLRVPSMIQGELMSA